MNSGPAWPGRNILRFKTQEEFKAVRAGGQAAATECTLLAALLLPDEVSQ